MQAMDIVRVAYTRLVQTCTMVQLCQLLLSLVLLLIRGFVLFCWF